MKMPKLFFLLIILIMTRFGSFGQVPETKHADISVFEINQTREKISCVQNQLTVSGLKEKEFDRILIVDMQGTVVLKHTITRPTMLLDVSNLEEGVHILVLRSTQTMKERTMKFVVRR